MTIKNFAIRILFVFQFFFIHSAVANEDVSMSFEDTVYKIRSHEKDYQILFKKRAAIYYLKHHSKNFDKLKKYLEASQTNGTPVIVRIDANTLEIIDQANHED